MLNLRAVQEIADRLSYPETALWVRERQHEYLEGVSSGFVVAEEVKGRPAPRSPGDINLSHD